ncbi:hypothetical protein [Actinocrispum wychmicini]|nr:hypothetical protein [Actinocrispum wychmicini]
MSTAVFWTFFAVAVLSWTAVACRWLLNKTGVGKRVAVWRWRRQDRVRRR